MEAIDQQRTREAGYRNVAMFEVGFVGKVRNCCCLPTYQSLGLCLSHLTLVLLIFCHCQHCMSI
jgi:hypothetical protein